MNYEEVSSFGFQVLDKARKILGFEFRVSGKKVQGFRFRGLGRVDLFKIVT